MQTPVSSQGFEYGVKHFFAPTEGLLADIVQNVLNLSQLECALLFQLGSVYANNIRSQGTVTVQIGAHVRVHTKPRRYKVDYNWKSRLVFENQDFVVLNKPSGLPSHPSVDNQIENSLTQTSLALKTKLLITHRLDSLTEGLIVYAKNNSFVNSFNQQLQNKTIEKKYVALVETQTILANHLIHYMEPSPRAPKKVSPNFKEGWDFCELKIEDQKREAYFTWVKINLLTGRTHQIRSQFSEIAAPVLGDEMYGSKEKYKPNQIALRAQSIQFNWQGQTHKFELPEKFDI